MRNFISLVLAFAIIISTVPLVSFLYKDEIISAGASIVSDDNTEAAKSSEQTTSEVQNKANVEKKVENKVKSDKVKVYITKSKKISEVSLKYYLISVLAKEIDINSPDEALKAQGVCIYTFLLHAQENTQKEKYDITDNPAVHQSFLSKSDLQKFWGDNYSANYKRLETIVDSIYGEYISYNSEIILAAYHSSNAGFTESSENYWGSAYPYLVATLSTGDKLCSDYNTAVKFTPKDLKAKLLTIKNKKLQFSESPSDWIGENSLTKSGTVKEITIAGEVLTGREVREALGLKSSFFTTQYKNGNFIFTTSGYGHGVGLSQEGAKYMANLGFSYKDIILHYYNGVEIEGSNNV